jgi:hypothetical protein
MTGRRTPLLLTLPILERMRAVEGWLEDEEADLLLAGVSRSLAELPPPRAIVEVGSFCGRSTTVLGSAAKALDDEARVYAIDPHEGEVGARDQGIVRCASTLPAFERNIARAGLSEVVVTVQRRAREVEWERPIALLLIDGLHDYASVSGDFLHFEPWLPEGAYAAFHDYADYYPGVKAFVDELLATGRWDRLHLAASLMLVRRRRRGSGGPA